MESLRVTRAAWSCWLAADSVLASTLITLNVNITQPAQTGWLAGLENFRRLDLLSMNLVVWDSADAVAVCQLHLTELQMLSIGGKNPSEAAPPPNVLDHFIQHVSFAHRLRRLSLDVPSSAVMAVAECFAHPFTQLQRLEVGGVPSNSFELYKQAVNPKKTRSQWLASRRCRRRNPFKLYTSVPQKQKLRPLQEEAGTPYTPTRRHRFAVNAYPRL